LAMLDSAVSTGMLRAMAVKEGFHFEETLTGFKWLGNTALQLRQRGYDACYAFEEAIGYMFANVIPDKDSVSAGAVFLTAMSRWKAREGLTPWGKLQDLYRIYGFFQEANTYFVSPSPELTGRIFSDIRHMATPYPDMLGKRRILRWRDLTEGYDSATGGLPALQVSKDSQMITCELEGKVKFTVRGSGTEPKIKGKQDPLPPPRSPARSPASVPARTSCSRACSGQKTREADDGTTVYIECQADSLVEARRDAEAVLQDLAREWFRPDLYGLVTA
jgi:phosphoglucomutase